MEVREIKALLALMREYELVELEIDDKKKGRVRFVREASGRCPAPGDHPKVGGAQPEPNMSAPRHIRAPAAAEGGATESAPLAENQRLVTSPMVGTFYRAPTPDAAPFVDEGDSVRKGQTLCIIEAMKMMNEIEADVTGRIAKILCENAQPVEYGQPLMLVELT
jgi:acetyl-CoA carboxylase biotin carboxyl carrier protein